MTTRSSTIPELRLKGLNDWSNDDIERQRVLCVTATPSARALRRAPADIDVGRMCGLNSAIIDCLRQLASKKHVEGRLHQHETTIGQGKTWRGIAPTASKNHVKRRLHQQHTTISQGETCRGTPAPTAHDHRPGTPYRGQQTKST